MSNIIDDTFIYIDDLTIPAKIGVLAEEKGIDQLVVITLTIAYDFRIACLSDELSHTMDYAAVCEDVKEICLAKHYSLCEHLAHTIGSHIINQYRALSVDVNILKPNAVEECRGVGANLTIYADPEDDPE